MSETIVLSKQIANVRQAIKDCYDLNMANDCRALLKACCDKYGKLEKLSDDQAKAMSKELKDIAARCGVGRDGDGAQKTDAGAILEINDYFQDDAVLQRGKSIPITGKTSPDVIVHAKLGTYEGWGHSDTAGYFAFSLPPMPAIESATLVITAGKKHRSFKNIAVGDVYLLGGQSNMEFRLFSNIPGMEALKDKDFDGIRYLDVPLRTYHGQRHELGGAKWKISTRETASNFSALGFFYARLVHKAEKVVVGVVNTSVGGAAAETLVSRTSLMSIPELRDELLEYDRFISSKPEAMTLTPAPKLMKGVKKIFPTVPEDIGLKLHYEKPDFDDGDWETMDLPDNWTQAGHNHAGIFWFRRTIELKDCAPDEKWELHLGAVDKADITFINGVKIGAMCSPVEFAWNLQRVYNVPKGILHKGKNILAVQASSMMSTLEDGGLIGPIEEMYLLRRSTGEKIPISGEWRLRETYDAGTIGMTFMRTLGAGAAQSMHILYDNMIVPLTGIPFAAVLFYQGEANAICEANSYEQIMSLLIDDWRNVLQDRALPFVMFQLPEIGRPCVLGKYSQWAVLRKAQMNVASKMSNVYCVVTLGTSDGREIHPFNKIPLAERAFAMLNKGKSAPILKEVKFEKRGAVLTFDGEPLDTSIPAEGFALADANGKESVAVKAEYLSEHSIRVSSKDITTPTKIWYAWADNPVPATLSGKNGLRVSPINN